MIDRDHALSLVHQCELLGLSRSSQYYQPVPVSAADLTLMRAVDELHLRYPFYGSRRLTGELRDQGFAVGRRQVSWVPWDLACERNWLSIERSVLTAEEKS